MSTLPITRSRALRLGPVASLCILIVAGALVSTFGKPVGSDAAAGTFAVYLQPASVPAEERLNQAADDIAEVLAGREFRIVETVPELEAMVATTEPQSIWVHADAIEAVSPDLLRSAMLNGAVIVGIDMPSSTLAPILKVSGGSTPDWHPDGVMTFVLYAEVLYVPSINDQGQTTTRSFRTRANERFDPANPAGLLSIVNQTIEQIHDMDE